MRVFDWLDSMVGDRFANKDDPPKTQILAHLGVVAVAVLALAYVIFSFGEFSEIRPPQVLILGAAAFVLIAFPVRIGRGVRDLLRERRLERIRASTKTSE